MFINASQIVTGDQVTVAGNSIGSVSGISLDPRRSRTADADDRQLDVQPAPPGHRGDRPPDLAVGRRQPLCRPAPRACQRARDPRPRGDRHHRHDQRRRSRSAVQHAQPADAQGPPGRLSGIGLPVRRARAPGAAGLGLPEPGDRLQQRPVRRAQPRHRPVHRLHRQVQRPGDHAVEAQQRSQRAGQQPVADHSGAGRAAGRARTVDPATAGIHAARRHHLRQRAARARRPDPAGRRDPAGRAKAAAAVGCARSARAGGGADGPDAGGRGHPARPRQRSHRPHPPRRSRWRRRQSTR